MKKGIILQVFLAGQYRIVEGEAVHFTFDEFHTLYCAEKGGDILGLAEFRKKGKPARLKKLGNEFWGQVVQSCPEKRCVMVKISAKGGNE